MTVAQTKAAEISQRLRNSDSVFAQQEAGEVGDLLTISIILSIIYNAIQLYQFCGFQPVGACDSLNSQGVFMRFQMRRLINKECRGKPHEQRKNLRAQMERELLRTAAGMTLPEVEQLYEESKAS